jgi:hypothetical protein
MNTTILRWFLFGWCVCLGGVFEVDGWAEESPCGAVESALRIAGELRGLTRESAPRCRVVSRATAQAILTGDLAPQIDRAALEAEAVVYRLLGFLPAEFDYVGCVLDGYGGDTPAFYRHGRDEIVVAEGQVPFELLIHEAVHALQHHRFDLGALASRSAQTSDGWLARFGLVEGDAMGIEAASAAVSPLGAGSSLGAVSESPPPPRCTIPPQLDDLLAFPYTVGREFVDGIRTQFGNAGVDRMFHRPPRSSSELLHPERYLARIEKPERGGGASTKKGGGFSDTLGEYFIRTWLRLSLKAREADQVAAEWRHDVVTLHQPAAAAPRLTWRTEWRDGRAAREFYAVVLRTLGARFGLAPLRSESPRILIGVPRFGSITLRYRDETVTIVIEGAALAA